MIAEKLNDQEVQTIVFVYMHELINRYSNESDSLSMPFYYLSEEFQNLLQQIRQTSAFKVSSKQDHLCSLTRLLDYFAPDYSREFFSLLLLALPK
jgi:hypothetical protein